MFVSKGMKSEAQLLKIIPAGSTLRLKFTPAQPGKQQRRGQARSPGGGSPLRPGQASAPCPTVPWRHQPKLASSLSISDWSIAFCGSCGPFRSAASSSAAAAAVAEAPPGGGLAAGFIIAAFSAVCGFALIWHMWLIAGVSFAAMLAAAIIHTFNYNRDFYIPAEEVVSVEHQRTQLLAGHV